ncbi:PSE family carbenicillin-hydrolyzing class A beta-lactamase [Vibrio metschnikovii]|uniref:PSE family carbenicillin-hydrolyzing class A beta-lactamase n=1 Tax=Vibrio metschnikovii TaxID=28172 RepID=UPI001C2F8CF1|nr:PSE family carbenicillin-hydrolyzing class A beta-lactamase [Vibrio metschnikovii]
MKLLLVFSLLIPSIVFANSSKFQQVEQDAKVIEASLSAHIGISVLDTQTGESWDYNGNQRFPLTSTFKTIACAKLLYDAEQGKINSKSTVEIKKADLVTYSPVIEKQVGQAITLDDACFATMTTSDNAAANIILNALGGPESVTDFLRQIGDKETRLDRIEPELNEGKLGDLRDTTTPNAIVNTLNELLFGSTLSQDGQKKLEYWMVNNQVTGNLLRSVLPEGWNIADRSGAGGFGARSITAVVWSEAQSPIIVSIYLAQTEASIADRNDAIVKIGRSIFEVYSSQSR